MINRDTSSTNKLKSNIYIFLIITFITSLFFTGTAAYAEEDSALEIIHHVYVDDVYIGKVDSNEVVQKVINEKIKTDQSVFEDVELTINESISLISEKVFNPKYDNKKVTKFLEDTLTTKANAVELKIGDQLIGYFSHNEVVEDVLKTYKLKFVSEKELTKIQSVQKKELHRDRELLNKKNRVAENKTEELAIGDIIVKDVMLSDEVSISEKNVKPADVLSVEQGLKLLEKGTLEDKKHSVSKGEVLGKIASKYDLSTKKLLELNPKLTDDSILQIDQEINVTEFKSFVDVIVIKEEKVEEKIAYETEIIESDKMNKGEEKVKQKGKDGKREVLYKVEHTNNRVTDKQVLEENVTKEPTKKIIIKGTYVIPSRGTGKLSWPAHGGYVSSHVGKRWGSMHKGIDIARPSSRGIKAADHGVVVSAGWQGGFGNKVVINHNNGMRTVYAHLSSIGVRAGQTVAKGTNIGVMGSTGNSTGIHLHFEVYLNGVLQNPMKYF